MAKNHKSRKGSGGKMITLDKVYYLVATLYYLACLILMFWDRFAR